MFSILDNAEKSVDYDKYLAYVNSVDWSQYGSLEQFQSEKYINPMIETTSRNALIKSISTRNCDDFESEIVLLLELFQIKNYLKLSYKGDIEFISKLDSVYFCGGRVSFNELFVDKNTFKHTFLIDNDPVFQIISNQVLFEDLGCDVDFVR